MQIVREPLVGGARGRGCDNDVGVIPAGVGQ